MNQSAIDRGFTHYTAVDGYPDLKAAVREKFRRDNDLVFGDDQVLVGCGAKQALFDLCQALLGPGDEAVVPRPYWVTYPAQVILAGAEPVYFDLDAEDGYLPDPDRLEASFTARTRLLFLNSPNNPTGRIYDEDRLRRLAARSAVRWRQVPPTRGCDSQARVESARPARDQRSGTYRYECVGASGS